MFETPPQSPKKELVCPDAPIKKDFVTMTTRQSWQSFSSHIDKDNEINALLQIINKNEIQINFNHY